MIDGNVIRRNRAGTNGGGISIAGSVAAEIVNNIITENEAGSGDGGGISFVLFTTNESLIRFNRIERNTAWDHGGGIDGVLDFGATRVEISFNLIADNAALGNKGTVDSGGGIWLCCSSGLIQNNTIVGNLGLGDETDWGGGIALSEPGSPVIERNIIALSPGGGGISCIRGATPVIRNNLAWGNVPVDGSGSCVDWFTRDESSLNVFKSLRLLSQILVVTLDVWISIPGPTQARTWTVKVDQAGDAPTVQAGIDSAAERDTVLVGPGTYYEHRIPRAGCRPEEFDGTGSYNT